MESAAESCLNRAAGGKETVQRASAGGKETVSILNQLISHSSCGKNHLFSQPFTPICHCCPVKCLSVPAVPLQERLSIGSCKCAAPDSNGQGLTEWRSHLHFTTDVFQEMVLGVWCSGSAVEQSVQNCYSRIIIVVTFYISDEFLQCLCKCVTSFIHSVIHSMHLYSSFPEVLLRGSPSPTPSDGWWWLDCQHGRGQQKGILIPTRIAQIARF